MQDKMYIENLLNMTKSMVSLYEHAAVESMSENIHQEFANLLSETVCMQHEIYTAMSNKGWYKVEEAEKKQISKTVSKYESSN